MNFKKPSINEIILLAILFIASVLRFWNFTNMPYMHDELSALMRANFGNIFDVINSVKTTDFHPIGVYVFVHYWSMIFGDNEMIIKLPFIICGIVAIYYSYKIAEKWFNPTVGLFTAACLATLQFPIMYSQLERPYASGLFFTVLMVWHWTNFFFGEKEKQKRSLIWFATAALFCTYNHYFSLLFAGMVGATGLFFINKENGKKYLIACGCVVLLFLPHLPITLYHFSQGAAETTDSWLAKPDSNWLISFIKYLFHYSGFIYLLILGFIVGSVYYLNLEKAWNDKMRSIAFVWATVPYLIMYVYSVNKSPVLQFSSMTFSLPFILMFIFSFYRELGTKLKIGLVAVLIIANTTTLFAVRKHQIVFYKQPYEQMALMSIETIKEHGEKDVAIAHSITEGFLDHYFKKYDQKFNYLRIELPDTKVFYEYLNKQTAHYFVIGNPPLEYLSIIKEKYPYQIKLVEGFTCSVYCFTSEKPQNEIKETILYSEKNDFSVQKDRWTDYMAQTKKDLSGNSFYYMDSSLEYGCTYSNFITNVINDRYNVMNITATIDTEDPLANPVMVFEMQEGEKPILWSGAEYTNFRFKKGKNKMELSILCAGLKLRKNRTPTFKFYIWNKTKSKIAVDDLNIEVVKSNPFIYGLYEPF